MDNKPKRGRPLSVNIKNMSREEYNNYCKEYMHNVNHNGKGNEYLVCECGDTIKRKCFYQHKKTLHHLKKLNQEFVKPVLEEDKKDDESVSTISDYQSIDNTLFFEKMVETFVEKYFINMFLNKHKKKDIKNGFSLLIK